MRFTKEGEIVTTKNNMFTPIKTTRISETIYNQISQKIIDGELNKGDKLPPERTLMELYQRSRPTIREALRMLEQDGLIETIPGNKGSFIKGYSAGTLKTHFKKLVESQNIDMDEVFQYRKLNDSGYIVWAAENRSNEDLESLKKELNNMQSAKDDIMLFYKYDKNFHRILAKASKNRFAIIVNSILEPITFNTVEEEASKHTDEYNRNLCNIAYESHLAIYNAVKNKDVELAKEKALEPLKHFKHIIGYE